MLSRAGVVLLWSMCAIPSKALLPSLSPHSVRRSSTRLFLSTQTKPRPVISTKTPGGDPKNREEGGGPNKHELLLFDDPVNTREYVSRVLCTKVGLAEAEAYDVMMQAHNSGVAVVGVYQLETAELYCQLMKDNGLIAAVKPVGGGDGSSSSD